MISVLCVDDEPALLEVSTLYLEKMGDFKVKTALSAKAALEILTTHTFDCIISDYQMPGMDGIRFLENLRSRGITLPFIIFTGKGREEVVIQALNTGADFYLQKGGDPRAQFTELAHKIRQAVQRRQAEDALRESEERYRNVVEAQTEFICRFRPDGTHVFVNDAYCRYFGKKCPEIIGKIFKANVYPEDRGKFREHFASITREHPLAAIEHRIIMPDGQIRWQRWSDRAIFDNEGNLVEYQSVGLDITEQKLAENSLAESRRRLSDIINFLPDATFVIDNEGKVIAWNRAIEEMTGVKARDMLGKGDFEYAIPFYGSRRPVLIDLIFETDEEIGKKYYGIIHKKGSLLIAETTLPRPKGKEAILWGKASPLYDNQGTVIGAIESIRDVTERIQMEDTIREREKHLNVIMHNLPIGIFRTTPPPHGTIIMANPIIARMHGFESLEEFMSRDVAEMYADPRERQRISEILQREGKIINSDVRLKRKDGEVFWARLSAVAIPGAKGTIEYFDGVLEDISERKRVEELLIQSENIYRTLFQNTGTATVVIEEDTTISLVNSEFEQLSGYSRQEIEGKISWTDFVAKEDLERMVSHHRARRVAPGEAPRNYEFRFIDRSGKIKDIFITIGSIPGTKRTIASLLDITERKQIVDSLKTSEDYLRGIFNNVQAGLLIIDPETHTVIDANPAAIRMIGRERENIVGSVCHRVICPAESGTCPITDLGQTIDSSERVLLTATGEECPILKTVIPMAISGRTYLLESFLDLSSIKKAEEALRESEKQYRLLVESSTDGVIIQQGGIIQFINGAGMRILGAETASDIIGKSAFDIIHPHYRMIVHQRAKDAISGVVPRIAEKFLRTDGRAVDVEVTGIPFTYKGKPAVMVVFHDITDRKQVEDALRESEELYRSLIETIPDPIYLIDTDGTVRYVNPVAASLFSMEPRQLIGKTLEQVFPPEIADHHLQAIRSVINSGTVHHTKTVDIYDGETRCIDARLAPVRAASGTITGVIGISHDITEDKIKKERLQESEEKYRTLADLLPVAVFETTIDGVLTFTNHITFKTFGIGPEDVKAGIHVFDYIVPEERETAGMYFKKLIAGECREGNEYTLMRKDGSRFPAIISASIICDAKTGNAVGMRGVIIDLTERKRAEEAVKKSEEKFRDFFNNASDGIGIHDMEGHFIEVNDTLCTRLGYSRDDLMKMSPSDIDIPLHAEHVQDRIREVLEKGHIVFETVHTRKDGTLIPSEVSSRIITYQGRPAVLSVARDITRRKQAEEALVESEEKYRLLLQNANDAVFVHEISQNSPGKLIEVNDVACRILGYSREELLAMTVGDIDIPEQRERLPGIFHDLYTQRSAVFRTEHVTKDGRRIPVEVSTSLFDLHGRPTVMSVVRDITERKRVEDSIRQVNRQLNLLNSITRHDILNKVTVLIGYLTLVKGKPHDHAMDLLIEKFESTINDIRSQIEFTRVYQDLGTHEPQWQELEKAIRRSDVPSRIMVTTDLEGVEIYADPMLERVFDNLLDNSLRHGQKVTSIHVSAVRTPEGLTIAYEDDGTGIPAGEKEKVFERGYGKGTGLGLFLVREILGITGIKIRGSGVEGEGARFDILVPKGAFRFKK